MRGRDSKTGRNTHPAAEAGRAHPTQHRHGEKLSSEEYRPENPGETLARQRLAVSGLRLDPDGTTEQQRAVIEEAARLATLEFWPEMEEGFRQKTVRDVADTGGVVYSWAAFRRGWSANRHGEKVPVDPETEGPEILARAYGIAEAATLRLRGYSREPLTEAGLPVSFENRLRRRLDALEGGEHGDEGPLPR